MGDVGSTSGFYAARPTIRIDNKEQVSLADGLQSLLVEETTAGLYRCEATFGNWGPTRGGTGFLYFDRQLLDFGKSLVIRAGNLDAEGEIFSGRIMAMEGHFPQSRPPEITILAEDRFQDLRMTRRTRTYTDFCDRDVFEEIASQYSLRTQIDINGPTHTVLAQVNQSDLAFLRNRARAIDAEFWLQGDTLHAQSRAQRNTGEVTLNYGEGLREFSVLADLAGQCTSLAVSGWDVTTKEGIVNEAVESAVGSELNGDLSGSKVLQQAFGPRVERIVHLSPFNIQEARSLSESYYRTAARNFVTGRGSCDGDARIRVGTHLNIQRTGDLFNGTYYVTEARHTFDLQKGYRSQFTIERPGLGQV